MISEFIDLLLWLVNSGSLFSHPCLGGVPPLYHWRHCPAMLILLRVSLLRPTEHQPVHFREELKHVQHLLA